MPLDRSAILAANHLKTEELEVPEFGGTVIIRELTAKKARELARIKDETLSPVLWVIASVINPDGTDAFNPADVHLFDNMSQAGIRRISNAVLKLNGLDKTPQEIEKNSDANQN